MQAKLEAVANVGKVQVTRSGPMALNAFDWTITFMTEPGSMSCFVYVNSTLLIQSSVLLQRLYKDILPLFPDRSF